MSAYYQHKAEQCERLAAAAADAKTRTKFREEGLLWREIALDIAKRDRAEEGPG